MGRYKKKSKAKKAASKAARRVEREKNETKSFNIKPTWRKGLFQCFVCMDQDIELSNYELFQHEELDIAMCDSCSNAHYNDKYEWHAEEIWENYDDNGKCMYCTICGEGGTLMACDVTGCTKSYCLDCLEKWMGKETLDKYVESTIQYFCCFTCFNENNKTERDLDEGEAHSDKAAKQLSTLINQQMSDPLTKNVYKNYGSLTRATKSYQSQKDKIDMEDLYIRLDQKLNNGGVTKECLCYCCFDFVTFTRKSIPQTHPRFNVVTCDDCIEFLDLEGIKEGKFDPNDFCYIKGEGGDLITCDSCDKNYCLEILEKWYGYKEIHRIVDSNDNFECFLCDEKAGRFPDFVKQSDTVRNAFVKSFMDDADFEETVPEHQKRMLTVNSRNSNKKSKAQLVKERHEADKKAGKRRSGRSEKKFEIKRKLKVTSARQGPRAAKRGRGRPKGATKATHISSDDDSDNNSGGYSTSDGEPVAPMTRYKPKKNSVYTTRGESEFESEDDEDSKNDRKRERMIAKRPATEKEAAEYFKKLMNRVPKRYRKSEIFEKFSQVQ